MDEGAKPEELDIIGIPQALDPDLLLKYDFPWTVSLVRKGIFVIAQAAGETSEILLRAARRGSPGGYQG